MIEGLEFDKKTHIYTYKGKRVLSVTSVLPDIPEHLLYKQFFIDKTLLGNRVHSYVDIINKHYMKYRRIPDRKVYEGRNFLESDAPYVEAYLKFINEHMPEIKMSEKQLFDREHFYAGTMDLVAKIKGKLSIADCKTTSVIAPYAKLQLAAYTRMYNNHCPDDPAFNRYIIHLKPDTEFKLVPYPVKSLKEDFDEFYHKLRSAQWDAVNMGSKYNA